MKENTEYSIIIEDVYKSFNVYYDKANTIKEKLLFLFSRNRKEKRVVLEGINAKIKVPTAEAIIHHAADMPEVKPIPATPTVEPAPIFGATKVINSKKGAILRPPTKKSSAPFTRRDIITPTAIKSTA